MYTCVVLRMHRCVCECYFACWVRKKVNCYMKEKSHKCHQFVRKPCLYTWLKRYFSLCHGLVSYPFALTKQQFWDILCSSLSINIPTWGTVAERTDDNKTSLGMRQMHISAHGIYCQTRRPHFLKRENIPSKTLCCHEFRKLKLRFSSYFSSAYLFIIMMITIYQKQNFICFNSSG